MNKKFTKLIAAFALLVFMMPSLAGWGQTRTEVVAYTLDGTITGSGSTYADYHEITQSGVSWQVKGNVSMNPWRIGGKNLSEVDRDLYSEDSFSDNITKVVVTNGTATATVNSMTLIVSENSDFSNPTSSVSGSWAASSTTTFQRPANADWTGKYFKLVYNVTCGSSNQYAQFVKAEFYKEEGAPSDFAITGAPVALSFDLYNNASAQVVSYTTSSTGAVTVSPSNYITTTINETAKTITVTPLTVTPSVQTITVSQAADANYTAGSGTFTVNITDSTPQYTVTYKANGGTGDDIADTYSEGDNVTVRANTFIYTSHAFTKWTTNQDGTGNEYQPDDEIQNIHANIDLYAQWEESNETVDILNREFTGITGGSGYGNWSGKVGASGAVYAGNSAGGSSTSNPAIQLRTSNSNSGIVSTTSGGKVTKVEVTWNSYTTSGRKLDIYGKNSAYSAATDLYGDNAGTLIGSITCGNNNPTVLTISSDYEYIGMRSNNNAIYLDEIKITWSTAPSISAEDVEIAYNATSGSIYATINNYIEGTLAASTEADWITNFTYEQADEIFEVGFTTTTNPSAIDRTATVTLTYTYGNNETTTKNVIVTQTANPNAPGTQNTPYTVAQAIDAIDNGGVVNNVYATGIVSEIVTEYSSQYQNVTFDIVDAIGDNDFLRAYRCSGDEAANVAVGDIVVVSGNLTYYQTDDIYEFSQGCQVVSLTHPISTDPSINATGGAALSYNTADGSIVYEIQNYVAGTMTANTTADWISNFAVNQTEEVGEVTFEVATNTAFEDRTATVTLTYTYGRSTVSADVTITQLSAPYITVTPDAVTVAADGDIPEFDINYKSLVITDASSFDVAFFESDGTTEVESRPEWINDYEISAGTLGYVLNVEVDENTGMQRMAYLKVFAEGDDDFVYSNLITITQNAPTQTTIDLRGTATAVSFNAGDFIASGTGYNSYSNVTYTGSNNVDYGGWTLNNVMHSGNNMQMRKSDGEVIMPTIKTDYGFTITVAAETNSVNVSDDTNSGTNSLTVTDTEVDITIAAGSSYAVISTITITPTPAPEEYTLTVSNLSHVNLFIFGSDESEPIINTENGENTAQVYDGTNVEVSVDVENGYVLQSLVVDDEDVTDEIDSETGMYVFSMPTHNVTITATAVEAPVAVDYQLFSGALVEGDYLIVYNGKAMNNTVSGNRLQYEEVTANNNVIASDNAGIVWHIAPSGEYWTIYNAAVGKYAASGSDKQAQLLTDGEDDKSLWTVSVENNNTYEFVNKAKTNNYKYLRNNGTYGFACYQDGTGGALSLYKKVVPTYTLEIDAYDTDNEKGWHLIASPLVGAIDPTTMTNLITDNADDFALYRFNQSATLEWENWKAEANYHFNLESGKGYLYGNKNGGSITFTGVPYSGDGTVTLSKTDGAVWAGWNLVGNPFPELAYLPNGMEYYTLDDTGSELTAAEGNSVEAMEGIFVIAGEDGETLTFSTTNPNSDKGASLSLNVTRNRGSVIDRAIVRFGESSTLPKFQLNPNHTKVYIPQYGKDYAVVSAESQGTMPVNFKAEENGTYTLSFNAEEVSFNYLHLIDNMTGNDVDLLQNPSYSFNATTTDYESRFKLVFCTGDNSNDDSFAFFSNGNWIINNDGEATLQVIDVNGRILSSETVSGSVSKAINATPGVYMIRLINGENVKVQKIVVR